jgi:hypothetical protein
MTDDLYLTGGISGVTCARPAFPKLCQQQGGLCQSCVLSTEDRAQVSFLTRSSQLADARGKKDQ